MFSELWKILGEKVSQNFTTTFSIVRQYGRRLLKFQDFLSKYESKSRHDSNERQSHPPSYPPVPESEFDEPNAGRGLFRNEDKIAKRPSCGETIQRTIFLYSVSTLRTPFPRNLGNYPDVSLTNVFREIGKTNPADAELPTLPRPPTLN